MYIGIVEGDREGFVNTSGYLFQIISSSDFIIVVAGRSLGPKGSRGNPKEKYTCGAAVQQKWELEEEGLGTCTDAKRSYEDGQWERN